MSTEELYRIYNECGCTVTTDSRNCPVGSLFFALKGEKFDGNTYAATALENGCSYAVVDEPEVVSSARFILVDNVLAAMQSLARYHRLKLGIPVLGITGTNGKTTTKELIAAVLGKKFNLLATKGNLNNSIGVPLTVLSLRKEHTFAVVEMGASHPGDIKELVNVSCPDYGIITNVGRAHLLGFGSFEGVKRTKGELYDFLKTNGNSKVFVLSDSTDLLQMSAGMNRILYGRNEGVVTGTLSDSDSAYLEFKWQSEEYETGTHLVRTNLVGSYNLDNALAAISIGLFFGVPAEDIDNAIQGYVPSNNRSQFLATARNTLIIDAYNANPTSMKASLANFDALRLPRKMVILGAMKELGEYSVQEHIEILHQLEVMNLEQVWLVGKEFESAAGENMPECFRFFETTENVAQEIEKLKIQDCSILLKGSNSNNLARLKDLL